MILKSYLGGNGYKTRKIIERLASIVTTVTGHDLKQAAIEILLLNLKETNTSPSERSDPNSLVHTVRPLVGGSHSLPGRQENAKSNPMDGLYARHAALDVLGKPQLGDDFEKTKSILEGVNKITYVLAPPAGVKHEVEWVLPTQIGFGSRTLDAPIDLDQSLTDIALQIHKQYKDKEATAWSYSGRAPGQLLVLASALYFQRTGSTEKAAQTLVAAACLCPSSFGITDDGSRDRFRELGEDLKHVFEMYLSVGSVGIETPSLEIADFGGPA